ncbi:hypothetical protein [Chitinophaga deserti]|uniref:hypothetical protein n=1 Tax=Chitinophaga deserti TaxID=2164099 RepID=UPI000D6D2221|nr:hypothetical protein [Chitinophaga deserti]
METTINYFFRDMGVMLGRTMRHMHRGMHTVTLITLLPIACMMLFLYVFGGTLLALEGILMTLTRKPAHR